MNSEDSKRQNSTSDIIDKRPKRQNESPESIETPRSSKSTKMSTVEEKVNSMDQNFSAMQEQFKSLIETINSTHAMISENHQATQNLIMEVNLLKQDQQTSNKTIRKMRREIIDLQSTVCHLEVANNKLEQKNLSRDVLISGLPLLKKEQTGNFIQAISTRLEVPFTTNDVSDAYSIPSKNNARSIMIIKFQTEHMKTRVSAAFRAKKPILIEDVITLSESDPRRGKEIFISSNLTPKYRALKQAARQEGTLKFVWEKDGRILVRAAERTPVIEVNSIQHLNEVIQSIRYPNIDRQHQENVNEYSDNE